MNYQAQTLNNCGPASIAILLGYYDHWITQLTVNEHVPPGASPCQIANYFFRYDLRARPYWSPRSDVTPIRLLLANGIPVIANQLLEENSRIGHYRVIKGYDDASGVFITDDPLQRKGPDDRLTYEAFDRLSNPGAFVPVYLPRKDSLVRSLMKEYDVYEARFCRR
jgi:hypothetical protein